LTVSRETENSKFLPNSKFYQIIRFFCYLQAVSIDVWLNAKLKRKRHNDDIPGTILSYRIKNYHVHAENSNMASSPGSESELDEPTLKEVYRILVSIQGTVATLQAENGKMLADIIILKSAVVTKNTVTS